MRSVTVAAASRRLVIQTTAEAKLGLKPGTSAAAATADPDDSAN